MRVGIKLVQKNAFSATLTQDDFAKNLRPLPTSPQLRAARQKMLALEDVKLRQCELGEPSWLATVTRPDICACAARFASQMKSLKGSDVYRINDLAGAAEVWQQAAILG